MSKKTNRILSAVGGLMLLYAGADGIDQAYYNFAQPERCELVQNQQREIGSDQIGSSKENTSEHICGPELDGSAAFIALLGSGVLALGQGYTVGVPGAPSPGKTGTRKTTSRRRDETTDDSIGENRE